MIAVKALVFNKRICFKFKIESKFIFYVFCKSNFIIVIAAPYRAIFEMPFDIVTDVTVRFMLA